MDEINNIDNLLNDFDFESPNLSSEDKTDKIKAYDKPIIGLDTGTEDIDNSNNLIEPLLTEEDLLDVIPSAGKRAGNFRSEHNLPPSNLIKKNEVKSKKVQEPEDFQKILAKDLNIREQDWAEIAQEISQTDLLDDNFRDFIELPKISGDERNLIGKRLIPANKISQIDKKVEISDRDLPDDIDHRTSIEINRDEKGDIESITVYCKCGEVTDIKFDYDDSSNSEETEYFHSSGTIDNLKLEQLRPGNSK